MSCEEKTPDLKEKTSGQYAHVASSENPAVALCLEAYERALEEAKGNDWPRDRRFRFARLVYCWSLPALSGRENIRDFIACVAHAMLLNIIEPGEATRLLYAAQVAQSGANRDQPKVKSS